VTVAIEAAFRSACRQELEALKPGNVHIHAAGHGMTVVDFLRSAEVSAPALCRAGVALGARILDAVRATREAVGQNTNLGIVLLCAPLAMAAEQDARDLRASLRTVLAASDLDDAQAVFAAIALAEPGGLGKAPRHDVRRPATVTLRVAMGEAAGRDMIARQWTTDFADVFVIGLPAYCAALVRWGDPGWAAAELHVRFMAQFCDSHVVRKHGMEEAERTRLEAVQTLMHIEQTQVPAALRGDLSAWDAALKRRGVNPGTSADLTVATLFADRLRRWLAEAGR
jgi:triphosphoribosyl-dephospho-CoA synthase